MRAVQLSFIGALLLLAVLGVSGGPALAQNVNDFKINSFEADYYLSRDTDKTSRLKVEEKIVAEFPAFDQNHGILRAIPQKYQGHDVELKITGVTDAAGKEWQYSTSTSNNNLVLKIGDANRYVHGVQTYNIAYTMRHVTMNFDDHDEFYWDVNGDQWQQVFGRVEARIHLAPELQQAISATTRCFAGSYGAKTEDCQVAALAGDSVATYTSRPLAKGETLTVVLGFQKGTFAPYRVPLHTILLMAAGIIFLGILPPLVALLVVIRNWRKFGRDPKGKGVIVLQYLPPKEASVLACDVVLKEKFVPAAISAQIVDLAVRHYIKIYEIKEKKIFKDKISYEVELLREPKDLRNEEQLVMTMLFGAKSPVGKRVSFETLKNKLAIQAKKLGETLGQQLADDNYFRKPPEAAKLPYVIWGIVLLVGGLVFMPFTLGISLAGLIVLIASRFMSARTLKGVELRDYLYGLRDYMKLAEAERIKVLQSPHGKLTEKILVDPNDKKQLVKLYEKLLPYAMLFEIEQEWTKQFAALYAQQPDWYSGSGTFQPAIFAASLHSFSAASSTSFSASNSSSSSGFGGGGFSGGGGGGGGGGGW